MSIHVCSVIMYVYIYIVIVVQSCPTVTPWTAACQASVCVYVYTFFNFFSLIDYFKILNIVPCAIK